MASVKRIPPWSPIFEPKARPHAKLLAAIFIDAAILKEHHKFQYYLEVYKGRADSDPARPFFIFFLLQRFAVFFCELDATCFVPS
jgi:hypothetical protein